MGGVVGDPVDFSSPAGEMDDVGNEIVFAQQWMHPPCPVVSHPQGLPAVATPAEQHD